MESKSLFEPCLEELVLNICADNEGSDKPVHMCSLINDHCLLSKFLHVLDYIDKQQTHMA